MKLELKCLSGYLPYEVKCSQYTGSLAKNIYTNLTPYTISLLTHEDNLSKPILRPISDLTKEIEVNGEKFVPLDYISTSIKDSQQNARYLFKGFYDNLAHWKIQRLLQLHFDIYGLIENGLAIDINTLP